MFNDQYFINKFPKIELSYDTILHKKVHTDLYIIIPVGIKAFAWFTYYKNQNLCVIMYLNNYNHITKVEPTVLSFDRKLSYGTIVYGTYFNSNNTNYFSCEDIYYYHGNNIYEKSDSYIERLKVLKKMFDSELQQVKYTNNFTVFGLPYFTNTYDKAFAKINFLPYKIRGILFRDYNNQITSGLLLNKIEKQTECIFKVTADIDADIYNLYCKDYKNDFYNIACIPDYKTSVLMNSHFRYIKENTNLDALEESDDEEEFENISDDKFVNLKKIVYMKCIYMKKFKKWKPIEITNFGEKLLTKREIYGLER
jgi:hypothetical protein